MRMRGLHELMCMYVRLSVYVSAFTDVQESTQSVLSWLW